METEKHIIYTPYLFDNFQSSDLEMRDVYRKCTAHNKKLLIQLNIEHMSKHGSQVLQNKGIRAVQFYHFRCGRWFGYADKVIFSHQGVVLILKNRDEFIEKRVAS
jgi:hypothetical protein